jgi:hypothetical protein
MVPFHGDADLLTTLTIPRVDEDSSAETTPAAREDASAESAPAPRSVPHEHREDAR